MQKTQETTLDTPLVSVIMPVYNCEPYLQVALESITKQTYQNLEIIVVDDASSDGTGELLSRLAAEDKRIKLFRNKTNLKIVGTLNRAVRKSHGKYLARMDGDDIRMLDSIEKQVRFMENNPDVVIVGGTIFVCDKNMDIINKRRYPLSDSDIRKKIFRYSPFCHPCVVMRAEALWSEEYELNWAEDYDLYFRLGNRGRFANLDDALYKLRTHNASISGSKTRYQEKLTLYIRLKAVFEYGYKMTFADKVYFVLQALSMRLMSPKFRFWLFNKARSSK